MDDKVSYSFGEGDRQLIILALSIMALVRPGFNDQLAAIANTFVSGHSLDGSTLFESFKQLNKDRYKDTW